MIFKARVVVISPGGEVAQGYGTYIVKVRGGSKGREWEDFFNLSHTEGGQLAEGQTVKVDYRNPRSPQLKLEI